MLSVLAVAIWLRENGRNHLGKWVVLRGDDINETICTLVESREDFRLVRDCIRAGDMVIRMPSGWDDRPIVIGTEHSFARALDSANALVASLTRKLDVATGNLTAQGLASYFEATQDASNRPSAARTDFEEATRAPVRTLPDPLPEGLSEEPVRTLPEPLVSGPVYSEDDAALNTHSIDEHSAPSRIVTASDEELVAKLGVPDEQRAPEPLEHERPHEFVPDDAEDSDAGTCAVCLGLEADPIHDTDETPEPEPAPKKKRAPKKKADA